MLLCEKRLKGLTKRDHAKRTAKFLFTILNKRRKPTVVGVEPTTTDSLYLSLSRHPKHHHGDQEKDRGKETLLPTSCRTTTTPQRIMLKEQSGIFTMFVKIHSSWKHLKTRKRIRFNVFIHCALSERIKCKCGEL